MSKSFLLVIVFGVIILGLFVGVCRYVTNVSGGGGGVGEQASGINAEVGKEVFFGDGQCYTCHKVGPEGSATRCPDQEGLAVRAIGRSQERGLFSGLEYLVESIVEPEVYIVKGYGKIMPRVYDPPILLNQEKMLAVLTYLQTLGGEEDVEAVMKFKDKIPKGSKKKDEKPWAPPIAADPHEGEKLFFDVNGPAGCVKCHTVQGRGAKVCPDLTGIGAVQKPEYFIESVLQPSLAIVKGYETVYIVDTDGVPYSGIIKRETETEIDLAIDEGNPEISIYTIPKGDIAQMQPQDVSMMPGNFSEMLSTKQLYDIVTFLVSQKG